MASRAARCRPVPVRRSARSKTAASAPMSPFPLHAVSPGMCDSDGYLRSPTPPVRRRWCGGGGPRGRGVTRPPAGRERRECHPGCRCRDHQRGRLRRSEHRGGRLSGRGGKADGLPSLAIQAQPGRRCPGRAYAGRQRSRTATSGLRSSSSPRDLSVLRLDRAIRTSATGGRPLMIGRARRRSTFRFHGVDAVSQPAVADSTPAGCERTSPALNQASAGRYTSWWLTTGHPIDKSAARRVVETVWSLVKA